MKVTLKPGKEKPILARHHWIFSGALEKPVACEPGTLLPVYSGQMLLGWGYFNPKCSLVGRMVSFGDSCPYETMEARFIEAVLLRKKLFEGSQTNCYRVINGEGDSLPGLIVDRYAGSLVIQIGTYGMEKLKNFIINLIQKYLPECQTIYEKSTMSTRQQEGLKDQEGLLYGTATETEVIENGIKFLVRFPGSQKTGFFLDQREMRKLVGSYSQGRKVLNCFSYTGGFSLYAAINGGITTSVDISKPALEMAKHHFALNDLEPQECVAEDIFEFLKQPKLDYDLVILDPPAFAKKKEDLGNAMKGYRELNRLAMQKMPQTSLLLTCSCSYHLNEELFQKLLFQAALMAKRRVQILSRHILAPDHPINLFHPESAYLKSFLLIIN